MPKKLSEMTLEELWCLFPIILTKPNPEWKAWYTEESEILLSILPSSFVYALHHIGSTAVNGIWAKPTIDMLLEIEDGVMMRDLIDPIKNAGYILMSQSENRLSFNKGYTETGFAERVFHLHVRRKGDNAELYFRDYLNVHPDKAKEYEKMKLSHWKNYEHDRDGYTNRKSDMGTRFTLKARQEFKDKY